MTSPILLVEELTANEARIVSESSTDGKSMWLNGVCMQSQIKNRNGRQYPINEIAAAVQSAMQRIKENNGIFGELDHPQTLNINSDRISHAITEMWMNGNDAYGKAKLLNTPMGLIAQELLKSGVKIGVSSRGAGNVTESGDVQGFQFVTYDIVITPSAPGAMPGLMYESLQARQGLKVQTLAEQMRQDPAAQKYFKREFLSWLNTLNPAKK
jgi:Prohead core protein serine protease